MATKKKVKEEIVQLNIRIPISLKHRLEKWLRETDRESMGALSAEIRRMLEEGLAKREQMQKRGRR
jgi:hypothetical protein